jgi:hypothetical protein
VIASGLCRITAAGSSLASAWEKIRLVVTQSVGTFARTRLLADGHLEGSASQSNIHC